MPTNRYFYPSVDYSWDEVGNWYLDEGITIPSPVIPQNGDSVYFINNAPGASPLVNVNLQKMTFTLATSWIPYFTVNGNTVVDVDVLDTYGFNLNGDDLMTGSGVLSFRGSSVAYNVSAIGFTSLVMEDGATLSNSSLNGVPDVRFRGTGGFVANVGQIGISSSAKITVENGANSVLNGINATIDQIEIESGSTLLLQIEPSYLIGCSIVVNTKVTNNGNLFINGSSLATFDFSDAVSSQTGVSGAWADSVGYWMSYLGINVYQPIAFKGVVMASGITALSFSAIASGDIYVNHNVDLENVCSISGYGSITSGNANQIVRIHKRATMENALTYGGRIGAFPKYLPGDILATNLLAS